MERKKPVSRRRFIGTMAAAFAGVSGRPLVGMRSRGGRFDLLIRGGTVFDGLGNPGFGADIAIAGGMIRRIGPRLPEEGAAVIEARGLAVAPGFIDAHSHTAIELLADPRAESQVRQGVTSEVCGNCGDSPFPVAAATLAEGRRYVKDLFDVELDWRDIHGFFARLRARGHAINHGTLLGQGSLRGAVMGFQDRPATPDELRRMREGVAWHLQAGALGLSAGLEYAPGSFAAAAEITELCRPVARARGVFAVHMRSEGDSLLEAMGEVTGIARRSGVSLQISHFKTAYPRNWGKLDAALAMLDEARRGEVDVHADRYPYLAGATGLSLYLPLWAREGTTGDFIARLKDPALQERLRRYLGEVEERLGSWERVRISGVFTEKNKHLEGMNILAAARSSGKEPFAFIRDLLIEEENRVTMVTFIMDEENLKRILANPLVMIGADGEAVASSGILARGKPHPRLYGTFARILGRYVRQEKVLILAEAIRKMTSLPARKFNLRGRGRLQPGCHADLVVFDPDKVEDTATFDQPARYPRGVVHVVVNGVPVIAGGEHTGRLPGQVLHRA